MTRQIFLDTETTGISHQQGHRIIEIGCLEAIDRKITQNHFHHYINPDRDIDEGAVKVHGITTEFLQDKPRFEAFGQAFLDYIEGAEIIIHNAPFDVGFLDAELRRLFPNFGGMASQVTITDTLVMARKKHPGQKNNLDALCRRYAIDNTHRELHGALLDAQLLAQVYFRMTGGQAALFAESVQSDQVRPMDEIASSHSELSVSTYQLSALEEEQHKKYLQSMREDQGCLWPHDISP